MQNSLSSSMRRVRYKSLENWSVGHIIGSSLNFTNKFPMVQIGQIVRRNQTPIELEDDVTYKQITVRTKGGGACLRGIKLGKEINTKKQYIVTQGQFIMSKIDARNGAFGVISKDLDGAIVTADFPVFDVNTDLVIPEFLFLLSSTEAFARFAQSCSRGTTNRQRIDVGMFILQRIPLPSLELQKSIVSSFFDKQLSAATLEKKAENAERSIGEYLLTVLGINQRQQNCSIPTSPLSFIDKPLPQQKKERSTSIKYLRGQDDTNGFKHLTFTKFKDIERWDIYNLVPSYLSMLKASPYPIMKIGDVYDLIKRRWNKKGSTFRYVEISAVDSFNGIMYSEEIPTSEAPSRATQMIKAGDLILGTTRPYLKKFAIVDEEYDDCICSSGFQVIAPKDTYNLSYLYEFLKSSIAISQFEEFMSGALYPAINTKDLKKILIPLPPLSIQNSIVKDINKQKAQIKELKRQALLLRKEVPHLIESVLFEHED